MKENKTDEVLLSVLTAWDMANSPERSTPHQQVSDIITKFTV